MRRQKGPERIFEEIMVENVTNLMRGRISTCKKLNKLWVRQTQRASHWGTLQLNFWKTERILNKRKVTCHIQAILNNIIDGFLFRNFEGQGKWVDIVTVLKEKKTMNPVASKTVHQQMSKKLKHFYNKKFKTNKQKSWGSTLLLYLLYTKCLRVLQG